MSDLSTLHLQSMDRISTSFFNGGDGVGAVAERSRTVDEIVAGLFAKRFPDDASQDICVLAVGGYGRAQLFPHSDVDLLFLVRKDADMARRKGDLSALLTELWDAQLRISQSVRTPSECARAARDNAELHVSLLDVRFLAGDRALYEDLLTQLPRFFLRERKWMLASLAEMARERHLKFDRTIYHLEPDIKEGPGGLRDYQTACWISQLAHVDPNRVPMSEETLPDELREPFAEAKSFLFAVRSYTHYFNGRDNNRLTFELQESIAAEGARKAFRDVAGAAEWMREYYRHARVIYRLAQRMVDEHATPRDSLFTMLRDRSKRLSNSEFSVNRGRVYFRVPQAIQTDPSIVLRLFRFVGRHGLQLSRRAERRVAEASEQLLKHGQDVGFSWADVAELVDQPHAYDALTAMHESRALYAVFPELEAIDSLVLRDFYHRYTVDEHSFLAIETLRELPAAKDDVSQRFAELLKEVESPQLLKFALLYHDAGRRTASAPYVEESVSQTRSALQRFGADERSAATVEFLVREQMLLSDAVTKRDMSDPAVIDDVAERVGTIERLRLLTLLTFADTTAVNPHAMTAWRRELLWRLYLLVFKRLTGDAEDGRIQRDQLAETILEAADDRAAMSAFLEGFPKRYLRTHKTEEVVDHFAKSRRLAEKASEVVFRREGSLYRLEVLTWDKPFLFASICATAAGFGLNIERAEAFANADGVVLDTFSMTVSEARGRADLDDPEMRQFTKTLSRVIDGRQDVVEVLRRRKSRYACRGRTPVESEAHFDNETSARASVFHVISEDRVGLLYDLASAVSQHGCDIEVVLIETQGRKAIDVFYVVGPEGKLSDDRCRLLCEDLVAACRSQIA